MCLSLTQQVKNTHMVNKGQYRAMWYILAHPEKVKSLISMNNGIINRRNI
jgi:hypothetical protein